MSAKIKDRSIQTPTLEEWIKMKIRSFSGDSTELRESIKAGWEDQLGTENCEEIFLEILFCSC